MKLTMNNGWKGLRTAMGGFALGLGLAAWSAFAALLPDASAAPTNVQPVATRNVLPWIAEVVKMNDAGISQDVIQYYVKNATAHSSLSADDIIHLRDRGIPAGIITAMIEHGSIGPATAATKPAPYPQVASAPQYYSQPAADYSTQPAAPVYSQPYPDYSYYNYWYDYPANYYPYYPFYYFPSTIVVGSRFRDHRGPFLHDGRRFELRSAVHVGNPVRVGNSFGVRSSNGSVVRNLGSSHVMGAVHSSGGGGMHQGRR